MESLLFHFLRYVIYNFYNIVRMQKLTLKST